MSNLFSNLLPHYIELISDSIQRYHDYNEETRFLLFTDKLYFLFQAIEKTLEMEYDVQIDRLQFKAQQTDTEDTKEQLVQEKNKAKMKIETIKKELKNLELFIHNKNQLAIEKINNKLDVFLLGPNYNEGHELMEKAKNSFVNKL